MAAEIERLIERLEKATGPDRELDARIARALAGSKEHWYRCFDGRLITDDLAPKVTESIDAALTLVPEGGGCVGVWKIIKGSSGCVGEIDLGQWKGWHETSPVIALCIACLKATAALRALSHKGSSND